MAKRLAEPQLKDGGEAYIKRQKIKHVTNSIDNIQSCRQLHHILAFDQDGGRARHGIQSFKSFLDGFSDEETKKTRLPILTEYLEAQKPRDEDAATFYLADIMQTWSFASQANNDALLSAVPAVLDLLMKTLSTVFEFSEYGRMLGRTLLEKRQLELLSRGLTSNKSKEFMISPCLRLLREVLTFDGGALAKDVFRARDYTFKALGRNLGLRYTGDEIEDRRKPFVRSHALRFFLACVKLLPTDAKKELLSQRDIISGTTREISGDPPYLVVDFLETMKTNILQDEKLSRDAKSRYFNAVNLGRIVSLYGYDKADDYVQEEKKSVDALAHEFLVFACTTPNLGILHWQMGFYPRDIDLYRGNGSYRTSIDLGLDSSDWSNKYTQNVPVRNNTLSEFIQSLRPWSDRRQSELLLEIFKAAPELVADYFFSKKSFVFDPKFTATWTGYSAFLFSTVQLPVPLYLGHQNGYSQLPPPSSIVIESILPSPLTQKVLTRYLNHQSLLVTFFTVRLLTVAFQKLQDVLKHYREATSIASIWDQAAQQLTLMFCQRCPVIKDVIVTFTNTSDADLMQKQATSKLLVMYHETVPQIALESKFDVSNPLAEALRLLEEHSTESEDGSMRVTTVENLFQVAHCSPGMRWFSKTESLPVSPVTAMLQLSAKTSEKPLLNLRSVLNSVIEESGILQLQSRKPALDALITALRNSAEKSNKNVIYEFLDNCLLRCSTTPVKYVDAVEKIHVELYGLEAEPDYFISLLHLTILEQWPFIAKSSESDRVNSVAGFIANYIGASLSIGENKKMLKVIVKSLTANLPEGSPGGKVIERARKLADAFNIPELHVSTVPNTIKSQSPADNDYKNVEARMLLTSGLKVSDNNALTRWTTRDISEVISNNHAASLVALLSSPDRPIRLEAVPNLYKLAHKLQASTHPEKSQLWLILSELLETTTSAYNLSASPLPTPISAFAVHALPVLQDPLHILYPKLNSFLSHRPLWDTDRLPLLHDILHDPPTIDDAHYAEVAFLLAYLTDGLATPADMAIFHKRRVIEKVLGLSENAFLSYSAAAQGIREAVVRLLWKATTLPGGSTTLVTRFGLLSWLGAHLDGGSSDGRHALSMGPVGWRRRALAEREAERQLRALRARILQTCDAEKVRRWSGSAEVRRQLEEVETARRSWT